MPMALTPEELAFMVPYEGAAFREGLARLLENPLLPGIVQTNFPKASLEQFIAFVSALPNVEAYQKGVIAVAIKSLLKRTSGGWTIGGLEKTRADQTYLYLSNHRDILCDPSIFCTGLDLNGRRTPQICLGDNLLGTPFVVDMVKTNKGVIVRRGLTGRELLRWSQGLSAYLRETIESGKDSVWLAQREGRAKDGDDRTQPGVLKMMALGTGKDPLDVLASLRPVPVAVSYELDPCDALKAREVFLTEQGGAYAKAPGEDMRSMALGIKGFKGRIHFEVGAELGPEIAVARRLPGKREQIEALAAAVDRAIFRQYRLWPSNHIADDELRGRRGPSDEYTAEERAAFLARAETQLDSVNAVGAERDGIRRHLLLAYANPVRNARA